MGRKKKDPTKVVRVPKKKPDFEKMVNDYPEYLFEGERSGFVVGAKYVWNKFILKSKKKAK